MTNLHISHAMPWERPRDKMCRTCYGLIERLTEQCPECARMPGKEPRRERETLQSNLDVEGFEW